MRPIRWIAVIVLGVTCLVGLIWTTVPIIANKIAEQEDRIYALKIYLKNTSLAEIVSNGKDIKYEGNLLEFTNGIKTSVYNGVEIKGRGNSTWQMEKKGLQLKLESRENLLGLGKAKKWVLLANALDDSNLRNEVAFELEHLINDENALVEKPVELYVDDEYRGLYYLTRKVEIGKEMVDLKSNDGIMVELDNLNSDHEKCYYTKDGTCLLERDVVSEDRSEMSMKAFLGKFDMANDAAKSGDWNKLKELIDVRDFAEYYLLAEFTMNPDAYVSSLYFYMDGERDLIHIAPGWDYDYALANERWGWEKSSDIDPDVIVGGRHNDRDAYYDEGTGDAYEFENSSRITMMFYYLLGIPEFEKLVDEVFDERMTGRGAELLVRIDNQANYIREAAMRNNERWELNDFDVEVSKLRQWVKKRYEFFERTFGNHIQLRNMLR